MSQASRPFPGDSGVVFKEKVTKITDRQPPSDEHNLNEIAQQLVSFASYLEANQAGGRHTNSLLSDRPSTLLEGSLLKDDNKTMEYVPRAELNAKLETIEARMDGRIARIEDGIAHMRLSMDSQKNSIWYATGVIVATFIAAFAIVIASFDAGRDTAKMAAESQAKAVASQAETNATLLEMRQVVSELKRQTPAMPAAVAPPQAPQPQ